MTSANPQRPVPLRALILSLTALAVPVVSALAFPAVQAEQGLLIWMAALVPAFLLAYYRGLKGVAVALAAGMAVLSLTQVALVASGLPSPNWTWLLVVVAVYIGICMALAAFAEVLHRERAAAQAAALSDTLTGLPNRRHAEVILDAQFAAATRGGTFSVALFDLDRFKRINDEHGHKAGDEALRGFGATLRATTRRMDLSARFGGEEFISVLVGTKTDDAVRFAERVRGAMAAREFPWGRVTVSAGVAQYQDGMGSWEVLVAAADGALYQAKEAGRDRVHVVETAGHRSMAVAALETEMSLPAPAGHETVVVVDDDPDVLRGMVRILESAGYRVDGTADPHHVVRRFTDDHPPDLLVTDVMMPAMNGLILAAEIVRRHPRLRVVYVSGYLQREVSWAGLPGSVVGFVQKPAEVTEFLGIVRQVLDQQPEGKPARPD